MKLKKLILTTAAIAALGFSINTYANNGLIGTVVAFAGDHAPAGCLPANGQPYSKEQYPDLYKAIGAIYGTSGSNPKLPDYQGYFLRGWNGAVAGRDPDVASRHNRGDERGGNAIGTIEDDMIKRHKHLMPWGEAINPQSFFGTTDYGNKWGTGSRSDYDNVWLHTNDGSDFDGQVNPPGTIGNETRPKNIYVGYCIIANDDYLTDIQRQIDNTDQTIADDTDKAAKAYLDAHLKDTVTSVLQEDQQNNASELIASALQAQYDKRVNTKPAPGSGTFYIKGFNLNTKDNQLVVTPFYNDEVNVCEPYEGRNQKNTTLTLQLDNNNPAVNTITAYLLSAFATGKQVSLDTKTDQNSDGTLNCHIIGIKSE
ncbi:MAG: tail fiber protein [Francisellaceae bacterium]